jgi:hypothetical protein
MAETFTETLALSKWEDLDTPTAAKLNANWDKLDAISPFYGTSFPSTYPLNKIFLRTDESILYHNTGTKPTPIWTPLSPSGVIKADGSVPFSADQSMGTHKLTNLVDPASAQDADTKAARDAAIAAVSDVLTDPNLETWAWRNQGSSTATPDGKAIVLVMPHEGGDNVRLYKRAVPGATPYSFEAAFEISFPLTLSYVGVGLIVNNNASGDKFVSFMVGPATFNLFAVIAHTGLSTWDSVSSPQAYPFQMQRLVWMKCTDNGTTLFFYSSMNGKDWVLVFSETRVTHVNTPDEIGIAMIADHATYDAKARLRHWKVY